MNNLDHVVIAAPDLAAAKHEFLAQTGVEPVDGGQHPGLGTRNALVSFGSESYLEIIAPDPEQPLGRTFAAQLATLEQPTLLHWAIRTGGLTNLAVRAAEVGFGAGAIRRTARATPDGTRLEWELMGIVGHELGGLVPFYIDWLDCIHPATTVPVVGDLVAFEVTFPAGHPAFELLNPEPRGVIIGVGEPGLSVTFDSPRGQQSWHESAPAGFAF